MSDVLLVAATVLVYIIGQLVALPRWSRGIATTPRASVVKGHSLGR